jgi:hypothetical protein
LILPSLGFSTNVCARPLNETTRKKRAKNILMVAISIVLIYCLNEPNTTSKYGLKINAFL